MNRILLEVALILLLLIANGIFAMAEIAIVSVRKARLQKRADEGDTRAAAALTLADEPESLLHQRDRSRVRPCRLVELTVNANHCSLDIRRANRRRLLCDADNCHRENRRRPKDASSHTSRRASAWFAIPHTLPGDRGRRHPYGSFRREKR